MLRDAACMLSIVQLRSGLTCEGSWLQDMKVLTALLSDWTDLVSVHTTGNTSSQGSHRMFDTEVWHL